MHAYPIFSAFNASANAALSTIGPLAQLMNTASFFINAILSALIKPRVLSFNGRCTEIISLSFITSSKVLYSIPKSAASCDLLLLYAITFAPNAWKSFATVRPMFPSTTIPTVLPAISRPPIPALVPCLRTLRSASTKFRSAVIAIPMVSSATVWFEYPAALHIMIFLSLHAFTPTWSIPVNATDIIFSLYDESTTSAG